MIQCIYLALCVITAYTFTLGRVWVWAFTFRSVIPVIISTTNGARNSIPQNTTPYQFVIVIASPPSSHEKPLVIGSVHVARQITQIIL